MRVANLVVVLALLPGVVRAAGGEPKAARKPNVVILLADDLGYADGTLYWRLGGQMACRQGDWKLVRYDPVADEEAGKPAKKSGPMPTRLYNLARDLGEANDLAAKETEKLKELEAVWQK